MVVAAYEEFEKDAIEGKWEDASERHDFYLYGIRNKVMTIFVDTSAWVALENKKDIHYKQAITFGLYKKTLVVEIESSRGGK